MTLRSFALTCTYIFIVIMYLDSLFYHVNVSLWSVKWWRLYCYQQTKRCLSLIWSCFKTTFIAEFRMGEFFGRDKLVSVKLAFRLPSCSKDLSKSWNFVLGLLNADGLIDQPLKKQQLWYYSRKLHMICSLLPSAWTSWEFK